jgi:hypothetical protein
VPGFLIAIAESTGWLYRKVTRWSNVGSVLPVVLTAVPLYPVVAMPPPYRIEDLKPVMAYIRNNRLAGDQIYVYYGAAPAFTFYSKDFGLSESDYTVGVCHKGDNRRYRQELDEFRGHGRVWVVLTHASPVGRERDDIVQYLDAIGTRRAALAVKSRVIGGSALPAEGFLYDLGVTKAGVAITAASILPTGPPSPEVCAGWERRIPSR